MNAVDTNVFVYALDAEEPSKQAKAQELLDQLTQSPNETVLLWQVAGEVLSCRRRWEASGQVTAADVEASFRDVLAMFPLHKPSARVFDISFTLRAQFSLSHWDSMLLAAASEAGVNMLYSEDMSAGWTYGTVKVVNPFE